MPVRKNQELRNGIQDGFRGARDVKIDQVSARGWVISGLGALMYDYIVQ
jgi:hypothetical protein